MRTDEVIKHFGSKAKVARALGCYKSVVSRWGAVVPFHRAVQLDELTNGELPFRISLYKHLFATRSKAVKKRKTRASGHNPKSSARATKHKGTK